MSPSGRSCARAAQLILASAVAIAVGAGLHASGAISSVLAADAKVTISDFAFKPDRVTVTAGSVVTWTNSAGRAHTVTSDKGGMLDSGSIGAGAAYGNLFDTPGTYAYHCTIHPDRMKGTVVVTAAAPTPSHVGTPEPTPPPGTLPPSFTTDVTPPPTAAPGSLGGIDSQQLGLGLLGVAVVGVLAVALIARLRRRGS